METVEMQDAKTHFSKLIGEVIDGNEFIVTRSGNSVAKITPYEAKQQLSIDEVLTRADKLRESITNRCSVLTKGKHLPNLAVKAPSGKEFRSR